VYELRYVTLSESRRVRHTMRFPSAGAARNWAVRYAHIVDASVWLGHTCIWSN
jgi:hypothetical protein